MASLIKTADSHAVLHIPHSSTEIPNSIRPTLLLSDLALEQELLRLTDHYTDQLFALDPLLATPLVFAVSRFVVDPERFADDNLEPMARVGMGAVYTATTEGGLLRAKYPVQRAAEQRAELLARFYEPHHAELEEATEAVLTATGRCLIIDCHSFPEVPLPCDQDQDQPRPDVCIGTDGFHTPAWIKASAVASFEAHDLTLAVNRPYAGTLVPMRWYKRDARVTALMVEINRRLYMNEKTGEKRAVFAQTAEMVRSVLTSLIAEHSEGVKQRE